MTPDVFVMRSPVAPPCSVNAYPSQLHPRTRVGAGTGSGLHTRQDRGRFRTPRDDRMREQQLCEEQDIAVLIALGVL